MLDIIQLGNDLLIGITKGYLCIWPFRFTAVAAKDDGHWRFYQMQFSFATTRTPDVQIVKTKP